MCFGQHSAQLAICCSDVQNICSQSGFIIVLGSPCCRFYGSSYLLREVPNVFEDGGEKFLFLGEGILVKESFDSV